MKATRKCSFCGKSFVTRSGMQRYCSEACQAEAKRARVMQKNNLFKVAQPLMEIQHQEYLTFSKAAILMGCSHQGNHLHLPYLPKEKKGKRKAKKCWTSIRARR